MATWEDGPEYAPLERPADYAAAVVAPLSIAPPVTQAAAAAPKDRPLFDQPPVPVAPLDTLVAAPEEIRDPQQPFAVVSSTLTTDSGWGGVHWSAPTGPSQRTPAGPADLYPPPDPVVGPANPDEWSPFGPAGPAPGGPVPPPPPTDSRFPAPGTPAWFGPGPYGDQPPPPGRVGAKAVWNAAMPGLCITLVVGGLIYVLAPILFAIAFNLSGRVKVARTEVRRAFAIAAGFLGLVAVIATLTNDYGFSQWWPIVGAWSLVACWAMLLTTLALVHRALRAGERPDAYRSTWG